jgi:cell division protein FtsN
MPNQDYISRSPKKNKAKKKSTTQKKTNANVKPTLPLKSKLIILLTFLLIAGFSYGLWSLKTAPSTKVPLSEITKPIKNSSTTTEKKTDSLPKPPKEKWSYVKDLEEKEVEVGQYEVKDKGPYKMQCGSFKTQKQAEILKAKIAFSGLESTVQKAQGTNGTWYKVILGPYPNKRLAEKNKNNLKRNNINHCIILFWR